MLLRQIAIEGFRGVQRRIEVPFGAGFTVITGRNGSGKTSICDAVEYVLIGSISRFSTKDTERGETIGDYVWWRGTNPAAKNEVTLSLETSSAVPLVRTVTPDGASGFSPTELVDTVMAPPDPLTVLCQTTIFRDELISDFSTDLSEGDRFDFVNKAIGISKVLVLEDRANKYHQALANQATALERNYGSARENVARITAELSRLSSTDVDQRAFENAAAKASTLVGRLLPDVPAAARATRDFVVSKRREIELIGRLRSELGAIDQAKLKIGELTRRISELQPRLKVVSDEIARVERQSLEVTNLLHEQQSKAPLLASLAFIAEHGGRLGLREGNCPLCGSAVAKDEFDQHLAHIRDEVESGNRRLAELTGSQANLSSTLSRLRNSDQELKLELSRIQAEVDAFQANSERLKVELQGLQIEDSVSAIEGALSKRLQLVSESDKLLTVLDGYTQSEVRSRLLGELGSAQREADSFAKRIEALTAAANGAASIAKAAKRISREILEEKLAALNPLLSELYLRLRPHVDYEDVVYKMRGDVKRFLRLEVGDDVNPRFIFSSGQRRALGLAFLLAVHLSRPWAILDSLMLDEPIQHIDDYRALHLVELLSSLRQLGKQVVCTVEDPELADLLCRRLRATEGAPGVRIDLCYHSKFGVDIQEIQVIKPLPASVLLSA